MRFKKPLIKLGAGTLVLAILVLALQPLREAKARELARTAAEIHAAQPEKSISMLRVSTYIKPIHENIVELSSWYLEQGRAGEALDTLGRAPLHNDLYWLGLGKAQLEFGQDASAALAKSNLEEAGLISRLVKPTKSIEETAANAKHLYGIGLINTSLRILGGQPNLNSAGAKLLGELRLARDTDVATLVETGKILARASQNDPSDIRLHKLLEQIYRELGNQKAASLEAAKAAALKAGKP